MIFNRDKDTGRIKKGKLNRSIDDIVDLFINKTLIAPFSNCWIWLGYTRNGYGRFRANGRQLSAHRFSYELYKGPIPNGLVLDHACRNRNCVNPSHLRPMTSEENSRISKGEPDKLKSHCVNGHEFTKENTIFNIKREFRSCRICRKISARKYLDNKNRIAAEARRV